MSKAPIEVRVIYAASSSPARRTRRTTARASVSKRIVASRPTPARATARGSWPATFADVGLGRIVLAIALLVAAFAAHGVVWRKLQPIVDAEIFMGTPIFSLEEQRQLAHWFATMKKASAEAKAEAKAQQQETADDGASVRGASEQQSAPQPAGPYFNGDQARVLLPASAYVAMLFASLAYISAAATSGALLTFRSRSRGWVSGSMTVAVGLAILSGWLGWRSNVTSLKNLLELWLCTLPLMGSVVCFGFACGRGGRRFLTLTGVLSVSAAVSMGLAVYVWHLCGKLTDEIVAMLLGSGSMTTAFTNSGAALAGVFASCGIGMLVIAARMGRAQA